MWEVPGLPDKPKVVPFPVQWIPHTFDETQFDDGQPEGPDHERGFKFLAVTCAETGKEAAKGIGVCCLRCGIPLHPVAATMHGSFDPPVCWRCSWILILYK